MKANAFLLRRYCDVHAESFHRDAPELIQQIVRGQNVRPREETFFLRFTIGVHAISQALP